MAITETQQSAAFAARIADMEALDARYRETPLGERLGFHGALSFLSVLTPLERATLHRRFADELARPATDPDASVLTKVAWDFRARELALRYIQFYREVQQRSFVLTDDVQPDERFVALALTASGSVVALDEPGLDGARPYQYRSGLSVERGRIRTGRAQVAEPIVVGRRMNIGKYNTSDVVALAVGKTRPVALTDTWNEARPLFLPTGQRWDAQNYQVELERFSRLKDTLVSAPPEHRFDRIRLVDWLVDVAQRMQRWRQPDGGLPLKKAEVFFSVSDTRYDVTKRWGKLDLTRTPAHDDATPTTWSDVTIGDQGVVEGAPLVVFAQTERGRSIRACIEQIGRLPDAGARR